MDLPFSVLTNFEPAGWDDLVASFPEPHVLQTWEWGRAKLRNGWTSMYCTWGREPVQAAAMVLRRRLPMGGFAARLQVMYAPKGPLLRDWNDATLRRAVLEDLMRLARRQGGIFIKIDPDVSMVWSTAPDGPQEVHPENDLAVGQKVRADLLQYGWLFSAEQVQFRNTMLVDLDRSEEELLAGMKQKTRYNIRLAQRKGVGVRVATLEDLSLLYRMYAETSLRDGFVIREEGYYRDLWGAFMQIRGEGDDLPGLASCPQAEGLIAEADGEPVAGLVVFRFARRAWYMFGMSRDAQREKMPNHLLQWEAMRRARQAGCTQYDLWGAPDEFNENDPMWGVYRFKEGLGGKVAHHLGAWDYPARPLFYRLYTQTLPHLLDWMRRRGVSRTRQAVG